MNTATTDPSPRRRDQALASRVAGGLAAVAASVALVGMLGHSAPAASVHMVAGTVIYALGEWCVVWAMLAPVLWRHRQLPLAAAAAPGLPAVATARGPLAVLMLVSALCGSAVAVALIALGRPLATITPSLLLYLFVRQGTLALLLVALAEMRLRQERAGAALHESTLRSLALRRELDTAQLAVLSAQIEPHFLFNTLANVRRLLRTEPPAARQLLAQLRRYLEEALPLLRQADSTLGREAELVQAYLGVHQVRMGPRLSFEVDVPPALRAHPLPPMLLLTLVENAIKHGLAPQVEGGSILVQARREAGAQGDELVLTVADTGRGMVAGLGTGTGLANLQARLRTQHGAAARLALRLNEPRGMRAEVRLPWAPAGEAP